MIEDENYIEVVQEAFLLLSDDFLKRGASLSDLKSISISKSNTKDGFNCFFHLAYPKTIIVALIVPLLCGIFAKFSGIDFAIKNTLGARCLVPNNYLVWEFTRPVSNCDFCRDVDSALLLPNLTRKEFEPYAYSSRPIVVKNAASHWLASKVFSLYFFRNLYESIDGAYESIEEECQFLHFKSNFGNLREVFAMSERRALNLQGEEPWYVGWKNCHPQVLEIMKKFYKSPHFLPEDAETPSTNYVFLGYEQGAVMHLDYIPRLMWQGQVLGSKTWTVAPTPECDRVCRPFNFSVSAGDIVLLDTRIWYHGTYVQNGQFSLTVTSEYG